jgi:predicted Rossmann fold flavoprotein
MANTNLIVVGAGAGGLLAAGRAAQKGANVLLLEKMDAAGKKILISGKTRCNLTNSAELEEFILAYGANGAFLYNAFSRFFSYELLDLLKKYGVETKTERGGRIFPSSDNSADVVRAFERYLSEFKVQIKTGIRVTGFRLKGGKIKAVETDKGDYLAGAVVLAAGGSSFPATGSTGDGYRLAESLGHTIIKLRPALVPLVVQEVDLAASMMGVSLRNVQLNAYRCSSKDIDRVGQKSIIDSRMGEMMLTHFGLGGPITLLMSLSIVKALENGPVSVAIDLKPALQLKQLQKRLQRDFDSYPKRSFLNLLRELLPQKMIGPIAQLSGIAPEKLGHQINGPERDRLAGLLKSLRFNIKSPLPLSSAMVTAGGVSLKEIDPRSMGSLLVKGLYFCGEVMDIDADTGGYNLQAAFSTGWVAGESAASYIADS